MDDVPPAWDPRVQALLDKFEDEQRRLAEAYRAGRFDPYGWINEIEDWLGRQ